MLQYNFGYILDIKYIYKSDNFYSNFSLSGNRSPPKSDLIFLIFQCLISLSIKISLVIKKRLDLIEVPFPKHGVGFCSLEIFCCSGIPKLIHTTQKNFKKI